MSPIVELRTTWGGLIAVIGSGARDMAEVVLLQTSSGGGMSEQGWQGSLAAEGVDDWVVVHGGATAVFRVLSLGEAAELAEAVAHVPGLEGSGALMRSPTTVSACG